MNDYTPVPGADDAPPRILSRPDGANIAYRQVPGRAPGVVFLPGFMSDMEGSKALAVEGFCRARGQAFTRFDYGGHGASSGRFEDGTIGAWTDDAIAVLDQLTKEPQVLVGSSMGGWIMLLTALARPERVCGLVGIAPAPDFTEDLIDSQLTPEHKAIMARDGVVYVESEYGPDPTPFTASLIEEGRNHLLLRRKIALECPVRLLHGMRDPDVPWQTSLKIQEMIEGDDVVVTLVKDGDHRLSRPADLARLTLSLGTLLEEMDAWEGET